MLSLCENPKKIRWVVIEFVAFRQIDRPTDRPTGRHTGRPTGRPTDRPTDDQQTDRQTNIQTEVSGNFIMCIDEFHSFHVYTLACFQIACTADSCSTLL